MHISLYTPLVFEHNTEPYYTSDHTIVRLYDEHGVSVRKTVFDGCESATKFAVKLQEEYRDKLQMQLPIVDNRS